LVVMDGRKLRSVTRQTNSVTAVNTPKETRAGISDKAKTKKPHDSERVGSVLRAWAVKWSPINHNRNFDLNHYIIEMKILLWSQDFNYGIPQRHNITD